MNVVDLASGQSRDFSLDEPNQYIFEALKKLSKRGGNLRFSMSQAEKERLDKKFNYGFLVDFRKYVGVDDSLTYREEDDNGLYVFTTYFKPD